MGNTFLAFLGISAIVIMVPGPDTALIIRNALLGGRAAGVVTALGISLGLALWAFATSLGIVALLVACEPLFLVLKYAGAAYLAYLGTLALYAAWRPAASPPLGTVRSAFSVRLRLGAALRQGLVSNLGNPKIAVFFASLLPQFAPAGEATFGALMTLGLTFCLMGFAWLASYAVVVAKAGDVLLRPRVRRAIEGITGAVLIALGLRIAAEQR
jgi:threonine/homoserine/homoserine lactone efflux protein